MSSSVIHHTKKGDREKAVAGEHWKAQARFRLWTQDANEEWIYRPQRKSVEVEVGQ